MINVSSEAKNLFSSQDFLLDSDFNFFSNNNLKFIKDLMISKNTNLSTTDKVLNIDKFKLLYEIAKYNIFSVILKSLKNLDSITPGNIRIEFNNNYLSAYYITDNNFHIPLLDIEFLKENFFLPCINLYYVDNNHQELINKYNEELKKISTIEEECLFYEKNILKLLLSGHLIANLKTRMYFKECYYRRKKILILEKRWLENYGQLEYNIYKTFSDILMSYFLNDDCNTISYVPIHKTKAYRLEI